jgi:tetratricopeptide (TPR) repeat protein
VIEKQLKKEPEDHWLWSRLSTVTYERRDYDEALAAAEKALEIVPDCPLALWSYAGALDMLGRTKEAMRVFGQIFLRGTEELETPDEDANECWEGRDWTDGIVKDCVFRMAGCLAKMGEPVAAKELYGLFLDLLKEGAPGIYSRAEAQARLKKLEPGSVSPQELRQRVNDKMSEFVKR